MKKFIIIPLLLASPAFAQTWDYSAMQRQNERTQQIDRDMAYREQQREALAYQQQQTDILQQQKFNQRSAPARPMFYIPSGDE